jgi:hypothetical protein
MIHILSIFMYFPIDDEIAKTVPSPRGIRLHGIHAGLLREGPSPAGRNHLILAVRIL